MSVGLFTLQNADVKAVGQELDKIVGDRNTGPLAGILRIVPIERMNALLVITPQPAYLDEAKKWIARLDQGGGGDGPRFYVYHLQNQRAEKLGPLLTQAFTGRAAPAAAPAAPTVAPGTPAGTIVSPPTFQAQTGAPAAPTIQVTTPPPTPGPVAQALARAAEGLGVVRNIQVVADKDNNTLLIVATASEYTVIEAALKKLDVPARQVMIEVTVANVTLNDELNFGVDWLFKGGAPSGRGSGGLILGCGLDGREPGVRRRERRGTNPVLGIAQGFTYIINNANFPGGVQAVLRLLDTYGDTKVIANPHVAALDNQKATIKAGDKIPICQQTYVGTGRRHGGQRTVSTTSQYIDTGVLLQVTPHINAGGLVTLDVQVEVSIPARFRPTATASRRDQHAVAAVDPECPVGADDGDGRTHHREQAELLRGASPPVAHPDHRRPVRPADADEQPHRARDVHHAARRRDRDRPQGHRGRPAPQDGAASTTRSMCSGGPIRPCRAGHRASRRQFANRR